MLLFSSYVLPVLSISFACDDRSADPASAPRGFFGYGALRYIDLTEAFLYTASGDHYKVGGNMINAGLGVGYKYVYHRVGLEAFIGWGIGRLNSDDDEYRNNIPEFYRQGVESRNIFLSLI